MKAASNESSLGTMCVWDVVDYQVRCSFPRLSKNTSAETDHNRNAWRFVLHDHQEPSDRQSGEQDGSHPGRQHMLFDKDVANLFRDVGQRDVFDAYLNIGTVVGAFEIVEVGLDVS